MMDREATAAVELLASPDTAWNVTALFQCSRGVAAALREAVRGPVEGNVLVDLLTLRCSLLSRLSRIQPADRVDPFLEQCLQSFHMLLTRVPALPHMMAMRDFAAAHEVRAMVNPTDMQSNQVAVNTMQKLLKLVQPLHFEVYIDYVRILLRYALSLRKFFNYPAAATTMRRALAQAAAISLALLQYHAPTLSCTPCMSIPMYNAAQTFADAFCAVSADTYEPGFRAHVCGIVQPADGSTERSASPTPSHTVNSISATLSYPPASALHPPSAASSSSGGLSMEQQADAPSPPAVASAGGEGACTPNTIEWRQRVARFTLTALAGKTLWILIDAGGVLDDVRSEAEKILKFVCEATNKPLPLRAPPPPAGGAHAPLDVSWWAHLLHSVHGVSPGSSGNSPYLAALGNMFEGAAPPAHPLCDVPSKEQQRDIMWSMCLACLSYAHAHAPEAAAVADTALDFHDAVMEYLAAYITMPKAEVCRLQALSRSNHATVSRRDRDRVHIGSPTLTRERVGIVRALRSASDSSTTPGGHNTDSAGSDSGSSPFLHPLSPPGSPPGWPALSVGAKRSRNRSASLASVGGQEEEPPLGTSSKRRSSAASALEMLHASNAASVDAGCNKAASNAGASLLSYADVAAGSRSGLHIPALDVAVLVPASPHPVAMPLDLPSAGASTAQLSDSSSSSSSSSSSAQQRGSPLSTGIASTLPLSTAARPPSRSNTPSSVGKVDADVSALSAILEESSFIATPDRRSAGAQTRTIPRASDARPRGGGRGTLAGVQPLSCPPPPSTLSRILLLLQHDALFTEAALSTAGVVQNDASQFFDTYDSQSVTSTASGRASVRRHSAGLLHALNTPSPVQPNPVGSSSSSNTTACSSVVTSPVSRLPPLAPPRSSLSSTGSSNGRPAAFPVHPMPARAPVELPQLAVERSDFLTSELVPPPGAQLASPVASPAHRRRSASAVAEEDMALAAAATPGSAPRSVKRSHTPHASRLLPRRPRSNSILYEEDCDGSECSDVEHDCSDEEFNQEVLDTVAQAAVNVVLPHTMDQLRVAKNAPPPPPRAPPLAPPTHPHAYASPSADGMSALGVVASPLRSSSMGSSAFSAPSPSRRLSMSTPEPPTTPVSSFATACTVSSPVVAVEQLTRSLPTVAAATAEATTVSSTASVPPLDIPYAPARPASSSLPRPLSTVRDSIALSFGPNAGVSMFRGMRARVHWAVEVLAVEESRRRVRVASFDELRYQPDGTAVSTTVDTATMAAAVAVASAGGPLFVESAAAAEGIEQASLERTDAMRDRAADVCGNSPLLLSLSGCTSPQPFKLNVSHILPAGPLPKSTGRCSELAGAWPLAFPSVRCLLQVPARHSPLSAAYDYRMWQLAHVQNVGASMAAAARMDASSVCNTSALELSTSWMVDALAHSAPFAAPGVPLPRRASTSSVLSAPGRADPRMFSPVTFGMGDAGAPLSSSPGQPSWMTPPLARRSMAVMPSDAYSGGGGGVGGGSPTLSISSTNSVRTAASLPVLAPSGAGNIDDDMIRDSQVAALKRAHSAAVGEVRLYFSMFPEAARVVNPALHARIHPDAALSPRLP